jgi:hypothetical protein
MMAKSVLASFFAQAVQSTYSRVHRRLSNHGSFIISPEAFSVGSLVGAHDFIIRGRCLDTIQTNIEHSPAHNRSSLFIGLPLSRQDPLLSTG